jgi:hypothetical protein
MSQLRILGRRINSEVELGDWVGLHFRIRDSIIDAEVGHAEGFSQFLKTDVMIICYIRPRPLSFTLFSIHFNKFLPFDLI